MSSTFDTDKPRNRNPQAGGAIDLESWRHSIEEAAGRIYSLVRKTPLEHLKAPSLGSVNALIKSEHLQRTGSFKLRGAANKILSLGEKDAAVGVITSSTGNHGIGVAAAAQHRGVPVEVVVYDQVSEKKLRTIDSYGAKISVIGSTPLESEVAARALAKQSGRKYISPYNDELVIAGQGTIAHELLQQAEGIDAVYVAVGGGGLVSGIGAYLKCLSPKTEIVACWPANSRVMYECLRAGQVIEYPEEPTLSESTAGGVEVGSVTFSLCQRVIDRTVLISEHDLLTTLQWAHANQLLIEGAAAVALAALFNDQDRYRNRTVVVVSCGGNLSPEVERRIASGVP